MAQKRKDTSRETRSLLYGLARFLGDVEAVGKGPEALAKRLIRRAAGKATGRVFSKLFR